MAHFQFDVGTAVPDGIIKVLVVPPLQVEVTNRCYSNFVCTCPGSQNYLYTCVHLQTGEKALYTCADVIYDFFYMLILSFLLCFHDEVPTRISTNLILTENLYYFTTTVLVEHVEAEASCSQAHHQQFFFKEESLFPPTLYQLI